MRDEAKNEEDDVLFNSTRRIVVSDELLSASREIRGRRLENPPDSTTVGPGKARPTQKFPSVRRSYLFIGLTGAVLLSVVVAVVVVRGLNQRRVGPQAAGNKSDAPRHGVTADSRNELRQIEEDAKRVIQRISRDNRPYSFTEKALRDIQSRTIELSRLPHLAESLRDLQAKGEQVGIKASKEGLQPSLVILVGLALTKGGESGDSVKAADNALPLLASLSKTFGSSEGDSCLILIAAFREGPGTRRSHPLLKRMNRVVSNPLTERNIWYLNDQNVLARNAYELIIDTLAFGVITRTPRQFGLENDPLNF